MRPKLADARARPPAEPAIACLQDNNPAVSEPRFRALFDHAGVGMVEFDPQGVILHANDTFCRIVGLTPDDVIGATSHFYTHPADQDLTGEQVQQIIERKLIRSAFEKRYVRPDGMAVWARVTLSPLYDGEGELQRLLGVIEDISEQRSAEERTRFLMQLSDTVRPLVDAKETVALSAQLLGEYLEADRCAYAEIGADQDTMFVTGNYTRGTKSLVGMLRFSDFGAEVLQLMRTNKPYIVYDIDTHMPTVDVSIYRDTQIQAIVCVPLHKGGRFVAAMAVHQATPRVWTPDEVQLVREVASRCWESIERARVARHYRDSEQRYRTFVDTVSSVVWLTDSAGAMVVENPSWAAYTGQTWEDYCGWGWLSAVHPDDQERTAELWRAAVASLQMYETEYRLCRADGEYRYVIARGAPVMSSDGRVKEWVGNCTDNHDSRLLAQQHERLLAAERAARVEAERAGRMKDEFLATLSHELRTPLSAILGWSQLLQQAELGREETQEALATIERNARVQARLIEDLLDMSRIISGKIRLEVQPVDLVAVIMAAVGTVRHSAEAKGIDVRCRLDPRAGSIAGDPSRIQQVIWNLLSNSIKFTPPQGRIEVSMTSAPRHVEVSVSDTGAGIKPEFLPHVFERFRQADASLTRSYGGLGLGLAIVKQLIELHGGSIHVSSAGEGLGSTFTFQLPLSPAAYPSLKEQTGPERTSAAHGSEPNHYRSWTVPNLLGVRVLVVDDERDARELARRILLDCQADVSLARNGQEALQLLTESPPDVLVSDIGMPELDGFELIRRARARGCTIPAAALTAFARMEDHATAMQAGFQAYVTKPLDPRELMTAVARLAGRTTS
jgi:PAS domain S-box-containing protein